jgi:cation diffusion facilitator family transporter
MTNHDPHALPRSRPPLTRFAWLSIATALVTIALKATAYFLTGSVGLLSDALESTVNLVAAVGALVALIVAERPADEGHAYGHGKAEYLSSGFEGGLIVLAAVSIVATAIPRFIHPVSIADVWLGIAISAPGSVLNGIVAWRLMGAGKRYRSITLEADGRHLLTDVWTSVGVIIGVAAVAVTGWERLDPTIAMLVAGNIVWTGIRLMRRSMLGLLDSALPIDELNAVRDVLKRIEREHGVQTHALRTREAGARRFVSLHVIVPGTWSVHQGHDLLELVEREIRDRVPLVTVLTHLEPLDDPVSWSDTQLDRDEVQGKGIKPGPH